MQWLLLLVTEDRNRNGVCRDKVQLPHSALQPFWLFELNYKFNGTAGLWPQLLAWIQNWDILYGTVSKDSCQERFSATALLASTVSHCRCTATQSSNKDEIKWCQDCTDNHLVLVFSVNICFLCFMAVNWMGLGWRWLLRQNKTFNNILLCLVGFCFSIAVSKKTRKMGLKWHNQHYWLWKAWLYPSMRGLMYETECIYSHFKFHGHFKGPCRGETSVEA